MSAGQKWRVTHDEDRHNEESTATIRAWNNSLPARPRFCCLRMNGRSPA